MHYSLVPLFVVCGFSMVVVVAYLGKLATNKDTNWVKAAEPMEYYREGTGSRQFRLWPYESAKNGASLQCQAPIYKD